MHTRFQAAAISALALSAFVACSESPTAPPAVPGQLTVALATTHPAGALYSRDRALMASQESLALSSVQFVLSRIEAVPAGGPACAPDDGVAHADDACGPVAAAPVVFSLPLDGSVPVTARAILPFGSYAGLETTLRGVSQSDAAWATFTQANPNFANGVSLRVAGAYTDPSGASRQFVFTSTMNQGLSFEFASPLVVDSTGTNLTLAVNVGAWFRDASTGALLDPSNRANQSQIENNIKTSFRAFQDANRDGRPD